MGATFERKENNRVRIFFSVSPEKFEEALNSSYHKNKNNVNLPGFRKGRVTRQMIEMRYGKEFLFPDAVDIALPESYSLALDELADEIKVVSQPEVDIISISKEEGIQFSVDAYVEPKAQLSEYKGLTYKKADVSVTDADVEGEITKTKEKNSRLVTITDRKSKIGDNLVIDYVGFVDGEEFEGGSDSDYELELGSGTFIDTFEEQLVGYEAGEEVRISVTFPEKYHNEKLSGKPAEFKVRINEIQEKIYPEVDDEFAQDVSDFETLEEYKNDIRKKLEMTAEADAKTSKQNQVLNELLQSFEIEIPDCMIEDETQDRLDEMMRSFAGSQITLKQYAAYLGMDEAAFRGAIRENVSETIKIRLALLAIAENENFTVTDEDIKEKIDSYAKNFSFSEEYKQKLYESNMYRKNVESELLTEKALTLILDSAVEKEEE